MKFFTAFISESIAYTGQELRPHWIAKRTGEFTNSMVAFRGPCQVKTAELVDMEDAFAGAVIQAREMLHFLAESFDENLTESIGRQRLFIATFLDELRRLSGPETAHAFFRRGNDLFYSNPIDGASRKLSVSIVTASPVSTLLHFGVNIDPSGAPVAAIGLNELVIDPELLARNTLKAWEEEVQSMAKARCKVSPR